MVRPLPVLVKNLNSVAVATPEAGDRTTFNSDVDNAVGVSTRIDVWTH